MEGNRFSRNLGRASHGHSDPEMNDMQDELDVYYEKEAKEEMRIRLEEKRKKFKDQGGNDDEIVEAHLQSKVGDIGFKVTDGRRIE